MTTRQIVLVLATFATATYAGMFHYVVYRGGFGEMTPMWRVGTVLGGLLYSVPLLAILTAHELGHKLACWRHGIASTGPYFLPSPFVTVGTFGAFIRTHTPYPSRQALLSVGLSGPVAGFIVSVILLGVGLALSPALDNSWPNVVRYGKPWILTTASNLINGPGPVLFHPIGIAAWIGLLLTMLNLIPFRQFDGGHIVRAAYGAKVAHVCSVITWLAVAYLASKSLTWLLAVIVMSLSWGKMDDPQFTDPPRRRHLAVATAAGMFALCWNQIDL